MSSDEDPKPEFNFRLIDVSSIDTNPNNPRGPNVKDRDPASEYLKQSIGDLGILVPLVVKKVGDRFLLIDGERRYHAARSLRLPEVPAYVVERDIDDTFIQGMMFHIHMNRLQWKPAQELKASELLYGRLQDEFGQDGARLLEEYVAETGMNRRTARNRLQFLRWPADIKEEIYEQRQDDYWYVIEIEDKIIEPAKRNYPEYFETVSDDEVRRFLFRKLQQGLVKAAIEVREASIITQSKVDEGPERTQVVDIIGRLVREPDFTFGQARDAFLTIFPEAGEPRPYGPVAALNAIRRLTSTLESCTTEYFTAQTYPRGVPATELRDALGELMDAVEALLKELDS